MVQVRGLPDVLENDRYAKNDLDIMVVDAVMSDSDSGKPKDALEDAKVDKTYDA